jgi:hypothetical protein
MKHEIDWSKSHNGVMLCSFDKTKELMPEVSPILDELLDSGMLELNPNDYVVDVKVHMLMPKMYPCIPNWHRDFVPRDNDLKRYPKLISGEKMYIWVSGSPSTEFRRKDGSKYKHCSQKWYSFTQNDVHRGTQSNEHTWRCFIRVIPKKFIHPTTINVGKKRQHIQVYMPQEIINKYNW